MQAEELSANAEIRLNSEREFKIAERILQAHGVSYKKPGEWLELCSCAFEQFVKVYDELCSTLNRG